MKEFQTAIRQSLTSRQSRIAVMFLAGLLVFSTLLFERVKGAADVTDTFTGPAAPPVQAARPEQPVAPSAITGTWTAELNRNKPGEIQMTFDRHSAQGGFNMSSDTMPLSELQGLSPEVASGGRTNVNFQLVREAGTFACEGYFRDGKGAGFWTFTPSQSFVAAMRGRGYTGLTDEDLYRAAMHNLTTKLIEDLKAAGYDHLEFEELVRAAGHEVTARYIRELRTAGYDHLSMEDLIRARNHEIDSQYIKEVRAMGFDNQTLEEIIRLRNHEITPEYINDLKAEGYSDLSVEVAIRFKNHDIDRAFIQRARAQGLTNLTPDQLIRLSTHGTVK